MRALKRDRIPRGLASISTALLIYAVSASLTTLSAWLFFAAIDAYYRQDPSTGTLGVGGSVTVYAGLALDAIALIYIALGFRQLRPEILDSDPELASVMAPSRNALFAACFAAVLSASLIPLSFLSRSAAQVSATLAIFVSFATAAAFLFLTCVGLPLLHLARGGERSIALVTVAVGAGGITGEAAASVLGLTATAAVPPSLITYGGWPLLNLSIPFGPFVAVSALTMSILYRRLALARNRAPIKQASTPDHAWTESGPTDLP
ncbi:MAG TPA: hypothetical protein VF992_02775 [Thermoplasmata archaeon]